jgi:hypothetical protein
VILQALPDFGVATLGHTELVLVDEGQSAFALDQFVEFSLGSLALRAPLGRLRSFVNVTANGTNPFLCHDFYDFKCFVV